MHQHGRPSTRDWELGFVVAGSIGYGLLVKTTFGWLPDPNTPYPFTPSEMTRWGARLAGLTQNTTIPFTRTDLSLCT